MNLGQLIGELRARAEAAEERGEGEAAAPRVAPTPRGQRQHQVMALLEDGRTTDLAAVAHAIGVQISHAGALLHAMATKGLISRHGRRHWYRYTKLGVAPNP